MIRYPALLDGDEGAYGVVFPDIPGVAAMGDSVDEALLNAEAVLRDYVIETGKDGAELANPSPFRSIPTPVGNQLVSIPLIRLSGKSVRAGLTLEEDVAEYIDSEARRRGMTRRRSSRGWSGASRRWTDSVHAVPCPAARGLAGWRVPFCFEGSPT